MQPNQLEQGKTLEDDSDCFEESGIVEETSRRTGNADWLSLEIVHMTSEHFSLSFPPSNLVSGADVLEALK